MTPTIIDRDSLLEFTAEPEFVRQRSLDAVGVLKVALKLRNTHKAFVRGAFVCIPRVGIKVDPAACWHASQHAVHAGMITLSCSDQLVLLSGQSAYCGTLSMPVRSFGGGTIGVGGIDRSLNSLSSIKLFCVVGADNIPQARICLAVPAADIRRTIARAFSIESPVYPGNSDSIALMDGMYA